MLPILMLLACGPDAIEAFETTDPADLSRDDVVCTALRTDRGAPEVVRLGAQSGAMLTVATATEGFGTHEVTGLAVFDDAVVACTPRLTRVSLVDGSVTQVEDVKCSGAADLDGQLVLLDGDDVVAYPTFEDAAADTHGDRLSMTPYASRIGRSDDSGEVLTTWHSTHEVDRWTAGGARSTVRTKGFDTWVWGVSEAGGQLFVLDDGRDGQGTTWWEAVHVFGPNGDRVGRIELGDGPDLQGLSCAAVVPAGDTGEARDTGEGPGLGL